MPPQLAQGPPFSHPASGWNRVTDQRLLGPRPHAGPTLALPVPSAGSVGLGAGRSTLQGLVCTKRLLVALPPGPGELDAPGPEPLRAMPCARGTDVWGTLLLVPGSRMIFFSCLVVCVLATSPPRLRTLLPSMQSGRQVPHPSPSPGESPGGPVVSRLGPGWQPAQATCSQWPLSVGLVSSAFGGGQPTARSPEGTQAVVLQTACLRTLDTHTRLGSAVPPALEDRPAVREACPAPGRLPTPPPGAPLRVLSLPAGATREPWATVSPPWCTTATPPWTRRPPRAPTTQRPPSSKALAPA